MDMPEDIREQLEELAANTEHTAGLLEIQYEHLTETKELSSWDAMQVLCAAVCMTVYGRYGLTHAVDCVTGEPQP